METSSVKNNTPHVFASSNTLYSVEEMFDKIDKKFINFYGEYGRKIVNARREEWNKEGFVNMQML